MKNKWANIHSKDTLNQTTSYATILKQCSTQRTYQLLNGVFYHFDKIDYTHNKQRISYV